MKKATLFLCLVLSFSLCLLACSKDSSSAPIEIVEVGIDTILADIDNQARAEMNIGKATTMFVKISSIKSDHCTVSHAFVNQSSDVYMDKSTLAKLNKDQFVAIYGVVDCVKSNESGTSFHYVFKNGQLEDMKMFDKYVASKNHASRYGSNDTIFGRASFFKSYISERYSALRVPKEELTDFLVGTWERNVRQYFSRHDFYGTHTPEITFHSDGTYTIQTMSDRTSQMDFLSGEYDLSNGTWAIENQGIILDGNLSFGDYAWPVYKISDDVFIYHDIVFIRCV